MDGPTLEGGGDALSQVLADLEGEFPPEAYEWVNDVPWSGPKQVDLADIDTSNEDNWVASQEPDRVAGFVATLEAEGELQPIILYETPDFVLHIADGHHRFEAYQQLGMNPVAFVAEVPTDEGPWSAMHSHQNVGPSIQKKSPSSQPGVSMGAWAKRTTEPGE